MADVTSPFGFPYPEPTDLVRDGATDIEALAQAANDQFAAGYQFAGQRIYTSSGLFAKADPLGTGDIGLRAIRVRVVGGGGGGGGAAVTGAGQAAVGAGGGGGAYAESFITDIAGLSASETVTRGAGGAGSAGASGGGGGNSSFGTLVVAGGGGSGQTFGALTAPAVTNIVAGGVASAGQLQINGSAGQPYESTGISFSGGSGGASAISAAGGRGLGFVNLVRNATTGEAGATPGGGGGGTGHSQNAATAKAGGAGGNGIVIIDVFA